MEQTLVCFPLHFREGERKSREADSLGKIPGLINLGEGMERGYLPLMLNFSSLGKTGAFLISTFSGNKGL